MPKRAKDKTVKRERRSELETRIADLERRLEHAEQSECEMRLLLLQAQKSTALAQESLLREQEAHAATRHLLALPAAAVSEPAPETDRSAPRLWFERLLKL